jgi:hypothetical protein
MTEEEKGIVWACRVIYRRLQSKEPSLLTCFEEILRDIGVLEYMEDLKKDAL